jgi:hypothetical protein
MIEHLRIPSKNIDFEFLANSLIQSKSSRSKRFKGFLIDYLQESYGIQRSTLSPDLESFANVQSSTYQKERNNVCGSVQLSPVRTGKGINKKTVPYTSWNAGDIDPFCCDLLLDSGAFTDVLTNSRTTPEDSLSRQLKFLGIADKKFHKTYIVSYDLLIDEKYINGERKKQRWSVEDAWTAVESTIDAAKYLDSQRNNLSGFTLIQSCQGVDASQYLKCVEKILPFCQKDDVIGLGGWCILGRQKSYLPIFWETINQIIPAIAESGIKKVHIFGCTWYKPSQGFPLPPLQGLLALCDKYHLKVSTDSRSLIGNALWKKEGNSPQRAGAEFTYWRHNLAWVKTELATLREHPAYQLPPTNTPDFTQLVLDLRI